MSAPEIIAAASAPTTLGAAILYARHNISVIPCAGKKPALPSWEYYQARRADEPRILQWHREGKLTNVGVVCGRVSDNLVIVDLDGQKAVDAFAITFPDLLDTFSVTSGSGLGMHLYYRVTELPPTTRVVACTYGNVELRANGTYVVAPPSLHPVSGKPYTIARREGIQQLHHMRPVVEWIKRLIADKHGGKMPPPANRQRTEIKHATRYGRAALAGETAKVRAARAGRNDTLFSAALRLGNLVAGGHLSRTDVEQALFDAAAHLSADDGEAATIRTIASGLDRGIKNGMAGR